MRKFGDAHRYNFKHCHPPQIYPLRYQPTCDAAAFFRALALRALSAEALAKHRSGNMSTLCQYVHSSSQPFVDQVSCLT